MLHIYFLSLIFIRAINSVTVQEVPVVFDGYDITTFSVRNGTCIPVKGLLDIYTIFPSIDNEGIYRLYKFIFISKKNKNIFELAPWKYIPKFGGFGFCLTNSPTEGNTNLWDLNLSKLGPLVTVSTDYCFDTSLTSVLSNRTCVANMENLWVNTFKTMKGGILNTHCFTTANETTKSLCNTLGQPLAPKLNELDSPQEVYTPHKPSQVSETSHDMTSNFLQQVNIFQLHHESNHTGNEKHTRRRKRHARQIFVSVGVIIGVIGSLILCYWCYHHRMDIFFRRTMVKQLSVTHSTDLVRIGNRIDQEEVKEDSIELEDNQDI